MATGHEPAREESVTAEDVERAEHAVAEARIRAGYAGLSAAQSIEDSARRHEGLAHVQDRTVEQGVSNTGVHQRSASRHREAAVQDRKLAEQKRKDAESDIYPKKGR